MKSLAPVLCILSIIVGVVATLTIEGFMLAGMPNSSPEQLAAMKRWMLVFAGAGLVSAIAAIWLLVVGKPIAGLVIALLPAAFIVCVVAWLFVRA